MKLSKIYRFKKYLTLFQDVKFNIGLLLALALASVFGTLIPQLADNAEKVEQFAARSPQWGKIFQKLDFFNLYYSWWFIGMLALLAFDVIVCKLIFSKFPGFRTFKKKESKRAVILSQDFKADWTSVRSFEEIQEKIRKILKENRYAVKTVIGTNDNHATFLAARHRLQRYGSWISHVSIVLILLANLTGALYGFREMLTVPEGSSARMRNRPWVVHCDKFIVDWYADSDAPRTFASNLRLYEKGRLVEDRKVLVNEPLEHKKVRFYQASYGPYLKEARIGFFIRKNPKKSPAVTLRLDEETPVPGTPYTLRILQFIPDFSMDEKRQVQSRSAQPKNPALQILISENGKPLKAPWIFEKFPGMMMPPPQKDDEFILVLAEYVPSYYTGLQIAYDPGADLFWISCAILVLGLMLLFYFHHRKVWVLIEKDSASGQTHIKVGAYSSRGKNFEGEFQQIVQELKLQTS